MKKNIVDNILIRLQNLEEKFSNFENESQEKVFKKSSIILPANDYAKFESRLCNVEETLKSIKESIPGMNASLTYKMAEDINGVIGLKEAVTTKHRFLKYIWAFLFFLGTAATIYFLYATATEYFDEPTVTKVKLQFQDTYDFPPIVLCNDAWFDTEKALSFGMSLDAFKYSLGFWRDDKQFDIKNVSQARQQFYSLYQKRKYQNLLEYYLEIGTDLRSISSLDEFYNSNQPSYFATDNRTQARKALLPSSSVCQAFTLRPAEGRLGILFEPERFLVKYEDRSNGLIRASPDWRLIFATDSTALFTWPLVIHPYTNNILKIKVQKFIVLDTSDARCVSTINYLGPSCMLDCQNRVYEKMIKCQKFWESSNNSTQQDPSKFCNHFDPDYRNSQANLDQQSILSQVKESCFPQCPNKCEKTIYEAVYEGSDATLKNFDVSGKNGSNMTLTGFHILHDALKQGGMLVTKEVNTYSFVALMNNLGGTLGLFIGGTLMTLAQFILFFIDYFLDKK